MEIVPDATKEETARQKLGEMAGTVSGAQMDEFRVYNLSVMRAVRRVEEEE
jgi:hypothetical protein